MSKIGRGDLSMKIMAFSYLSGLVACGSTGGVSVDAGSGDAPFSLDGVAAMSEAASPDASADAGLDGGATSLPSSDASAGEAGLLMPGDAGMCPVAPYTAPAPAGDASTSLSSATVTQTAVRSGSDSFDWKQLPGGSLGRSNTPLCVTSNAGLAATISNPTGAVFKDIQGSPWAGNFAPGDNLLCSGQITPTGPITITFANPVSGVGAQMGSDVVSGTQVPFVEQMVLIGTSGQILATLVANGMMDSAADNSAVYIGATDTVAEIKAVEFFISGATSALNNAYCMNRLSIQP